MFKQSENQILYRIRKHQYSKILRPKENWQHSLSQRIAHQLVINGD